MCISKQPTSAAATTPEELSKSEETWVNWGLFISSFTEGLALLKQGLGAALLTEQQLSKSESTLSSFSDSETDDDASADNSETESLDEAVAKVRESVAHVDTYLKEMDAVKELRLLYVPTALYSLRPDSDNPAKKQRSRAANAGKERRNQIVQLLTDELFPDHDFEVHCATLDLDDGSVGQKEGSDDPNDFPIDGRDALNDWSPHLVYVDGGNTFWLHHCLEKGNWKPDIINCVTGPDAAVYIGKSAGAILGGETVSTATWKKMDNPKVVPGKEKYESWNDASGLNLAGGHSFFPHMMDKWEDLVTTKKDDLESEVVCLTDEEICFVNGQESKVMLVGQ